LLNVYKRFPKNEQKKTQLPLGKTASRRATAYTVPVAVLTLKVIQCRWFSCHLKKCMPLPISD